MFLIAGLYDQGSAIRKKCLVPSRGPWRMQVRRIIIRILEAVRAARTKQQKERQVALRAERRSNPLDSVTSGMITLIAPYPHSLPWEIAITPTKNVRVPGS